MSKECEFFVYLIEHYASYKGTTGDRILKLLDEKGLTDFIYDMYEIYHVEALENAFADIDCLIATGEPAW